MFIGIDPSQRHTGVCVLNNDLSIKEAYDIKTGTLPILESGRVVRDSLRVLFQTYPDAVYSVEKMKPGAGTGALLFYIQMVLLEELDSLTKKKLAHPLPVQLKSFIKKLTGVSPENKSTIVDQAKKLSGFRGRMSSHQADAYFLARLGEMASAGKYEYRLSESELRILSWEVIGGC